MFCCVLSFHLDFFFFFLRCARSLRMLSSLEGEGGDDQEDADNVCITQVDDRVEPVRRSVRLSGFDFV